MKNTVSSIILVVGIGVIILVLFIGNAIYQESKTQGDLRDKEMKIGICLNGAYDTYTSNWNDKCNLDGKPNDCSLSLYVKQTIDYSYEEAKRLCVERYK